MMEVIRAVERVSAPLLFRARPRMRRFSRAAEDEALSGRARYLRRTIWCDWMP